MSGEPVEVRRSARRRRTVTAFREDGRLVVVLPASLPKAQEAHWVQTMVDRLAAREERRRPGDVELTRRARALSARYLLGRADPFSVSWADLRRRWGSCSVQDATIRVSRRLLGMPAWVLDYVLVHELAHLIVADHSAAFWEWVGRYPQAERARGFLDGFSFAGAAGEGAAEPPADR